MQARLTPSASAEPHGHAGLLGARGRRLDLWRPVVMGILNVTPDSFSDGGRWVHTDAAVDHALDMVSQGADVVDIGGESTRPGAEPVGEAAELERVIPVIEALRARSDVFISIDTAKPGVMRAACAAGADMINDVMGLRAEGALDAALDTGAAVCLMHMQGEPRTMQQAPVYDDVVAEVQAFLDARVGACRRAGIALQRLCIDPGFGFGKTLEQNMALMRGLDRFVATGRPVLVGLSRKSMFAKLFADDSMSARISGSLVAAFWAASRGARIVRAHDVRATVQALSFAQALADN